MLPRERQLAAINRTYADRISIDSIAVENQEELCAYLGVAPENLYDRLGIDGRVLAPWVYTGKIEGGHGMWNTTAEVDYSMGSGHVYPLAEAGIKEAENFPYPDGKAFNFAEFAAHAKQVAKTHAVRGPYWLPVFSRLNSLFGMEETMVKMLTETKVFEAVLERVFLFIYDFVGEYLEIGGDGVDILCLADDFATQRGMMFSPELWRKHFKPGFARIFDLGKKHSKKVWFHSCGNILEVLPDLIDIGVDVWETVQLHTLPMDAKRLKREFGGEITFFGGINTQALPFKKPEEVRAEVIGAIRTLGQNGGYICGPDHHIKPDVPPENVKALFDTALEYPYSQEWKW